MAQTEHRPIYHRLLASQPLKKPDELTTQRISTARSVQVDGPPGARYGAGTAAGSLP